MNLPTVLWQFWGEASAALPALGWQQSWLRLGWGLVLSAVVVALLGCLGRRRAGVPSRAVVLAASGWVCGWCLLPGAWSPAFWLGLAFQAPSLAAGAVALGVLAASGAAGLRWVRGAQAALTQARDWAGAGALLGWVLLLDSFALWPFYLYPAGFAPGALVLLLACLLAPWAWRGGSWQQQRAALTGVVVLLCYGLTHLPSGNVWDAMLDPWLMLLCHAVLLHRLWCCYRKGS